MTQLSPSPFFDAMLEKAYAVQHHAYAPYSNFAVGACLRAEDNTLYSGCNVENASYGLTVCAENIALGQLISTGKKRIVEVVIVGGKIGGDRIFCPPCGRCRQVIREFALPDVRIHLTDGQDIKTYTLEDFLPVSFGPDYLAQ